MWENEDKISEFLGFKIQLPEKVKRKTKKSRLKVECEEDFYSAYESLIEKIRNAEDIKNWKK